MAKYRKKPVIIEATQWIRNGDHPEDYPDRIIQRSREGAVVRRYRRPDVLSSVICNYCGLTMYYHGWIDTFEGGHIVCPGDWIITSVKGERYPCKPDIFAATYEPVEE